MLNNFHMYLTRESCIFIRSVQTALSEERNGCLVFQGRSMYEVLCFLTQQIGLSVLIKVLKIFSNINNSMIL